MNFDGENLILTFRSDDKVIFEIFRVSGPVRLGVRDSIVLYEHEIKEELRDQRFGIKAYHHPGVSEALSTTAPETSCFRKLIRPSCPSWGSCRSILNWQPTAKSGKTDVSFTSLFCEAAVTASVR